MLKLSDKSDIFISYSRHDSDVVNELVTLLEQEGYSVWIDRDGIESGDDFKRVILKAIKESVVVLFFSSEHSNVSDWTAKEIGIAVKYKKHIIPILLDDSNYNEAVEFDLINLDYVDYSKALTRLAMRERLFKTLRNKLGVGSKESERMEAKRHAREAAEKKRLEEERRVEEERRKAEQERIAAEKKQNNSSRETTNSYNGHEYVDLGLPSGTLWATWNIGAKKPEDYGCYFAWEDGKAAAANWGKGWRMPSKEQWEELIQNTKSTWIRRNGVNGRLYTAKNGNYLFLPAAGHRSGGSLKGGDSFGSYWSSLSYSWYLYFNLDNCIMSWGDRYFGRSVRAVRKN